MNKSNLFSKLAAITLTLSLLGVFAIPSQARAADVNSILTGLGINTGTYGSQSYYGSATNYNSTSGQHEGDIEVIKQVKDLTKGTGFKESITIRSGSKVQISIEVKNNSKYDTDVIVTDEIGGSSVFVNNSLSLAGRPITGSLTSGGVTIRVPKKSDISLYYELNVCSDSGYIARAYAYAPGIGSAVDGIRITTEDTVNGYSNFVSTCLSSFQQVNYSSNSSNANYSNPFGTWTGVNNSSSTSFSSNPFSGWTGVNNSSSNYSTSSNPFGDWSGVNNSNSTVNTSTNPFGTWTGVNNANTTASSSSNPFGDWSGVNNSGNSYNTNTNPFGTWTGVNNANSNSSSSVNPFGEWTGVNSNGSNSNNPFGNWSGVNSTDSQSSAGSSSNPFGDWSGVQSSSTQYTASGYSDATVADNSAQSTSNTSNSATTPYRVAPTTGADKTTPFIFAGLLTAAFVGYKKRKLLFN